MSDIGLPKFHTHDGCIFITQASTSFKNVVSSCGGVYHFKMQLHKMSYQCNIPSSLLIKLPIKHYKLKA
jgi:hypothetical protein